MGGALKSVGAAAIVYAVHYAGIKAYDHFCVPDGVWGFISGILTTGSPVCSVALKVVQHTEVSYSSAILLGVSRFIIDLLG